jgi:hypothetical protein
MIEMGMWLRALERWKQRMVTSPITTRSTSNTATSSLAANDLMRNHDPIRTTKREKEPKDAPQATWLLGRRPQKPVAGSGPHLQNGLESTTPIVRNTQKTTFILPNKKKQTFVLRTRCGR